MMNKKNITEKRAKKTPSNVCRLKLTETLKKHASEKLAIQRRRETPILTKKIKLLKEISRIKNGEILLFKKWVEKSFFPKKT